VDGDMLVRDFELTGLDAREVTAAARSAAAQIASRAL
jgi:hypothetical protein